MRRPVIMNQMIMFDHVSSSKIAKSVATLDEMQSNMGQALNGTTLSYHFSPRVKLTRKDLVLHEGSRAEHVGRGGAASKATP